MLQLKIYLFCYYLWTLTNNVLSLEKNCGLQGTFNKVLNGKLADLDEFPWLARLEYLDSKNKSAGFACEGALIDKQTVLTAGHCISYMSSQNLRLFSVRLGEYNTTTDIDCVTYFTGDVDCAEPHKDILVKTILVHPEYHNGYSDIALLFLQERVNYTEFIRPICLPKPHHKAKSRNWYALAGWGKTERGSNSTVKLKIGLPVANFKKCHRQYLKVGVSLNKLRHFCAGGVPGTDSCTGDSGTPLMFQGKDAAWEVRGITSIGKGCGDPEWPGIYTKVFNYVKWIKQEIKNKRVH